jgi:hypothetical protein
MQWSIKKGSSSKQSNTHLLSSATYAHFRNYSSMVDVFYFLLGSKILVWLLAAITCRLVGFNYFYLFSSLDNMLIYDNVKVDQ